MFIQIKQNYRCLKCGSLKSPRYVVGADKTYLQCIRCGHKSVYSTMTNTSDTTQISYYKTEDNEIEY